MKYFKITLFTALTNVLLASDMSFNKTEEIEMPIGHGINLMTFDTSTAECIDVSKAKVEPISCPGDCSPKSNVKLKVISKYSELERDLKTKLNFTESAEANLEKIFTGKTENKVSTNVEYFKKNTEESLLIIIEATGDGSTRALTNVSLKQEYRDLLNNNPHEFISRCGTHFLAKATTRANLKAIITVKKLSSNSKLDLMYKLETLAESGMKTDLLTADGKFTMDLELKQVIKEASFYGEVSAEVISVGGEGIKAYGDIISGYSSKNMDKLMTTLTRLANSFTLDKYPYHKYFFRPFSVYGAPEVEFSEDKRSYIQRLFDLAQQVQLKIEKISNLQNLSSNIYDRYFKFIQYEYQNLKQDIKKLVRKCIQDSSCDGNFPNLKNNLWLNDLLKDITPDLNCSYRVANDGKQYLDSISLSFTGELPFPKIVDFENFKTESKDFDFAEKLNSEYAFPNIINPEESTTNLKYSYTTDIDYRRKNRYGDWGVEIGLGNFQLLTRMNSAKINGQGKFTDSNEALAIAKYLQEWMKKSYHFVEISNIEVPEFTSIHRVKPTGFNKCPVQKR